jgi:hypothetical protein
MKKANLIVFGLLLTWGLILAGCDTGMNDGGNSSEPGEGNSDSSSSLAGTDWTAGAGEYLYFLSENNWARNNDSEGVTIWNSISTYSYSGNVITFNLLGGGTSTGTISGNTIRAFGRSYTKNIHYV